MHFSVRDTNHNPINVGPLHVFELLLFKSYDLVLEWNFFGDIIQIHLTDMLLNLSLCFVIVFVTKSSASKIAYV